MQSDGGWIFAAGLAGKLSFQAAVKAPSSLAALCSAAVALYSIALRVALAAPWCTPRCAQIFELYLYWQTSWSFRGTNFWNPMARVALGTGEPCERPWPDSAPESFHRLRSNIFEVCVLFERAHSLADYSNPPSYREERLCRNSAAKLPSTSCRP